MAKLDESYLEIILGRVFQVVSTTVRPGFFDIVPLFEDFVDGLASPRPEKWSSAKLKMIKQIFVEIEVALDSTTVVGFRKLIQVKNLLDQYDVLTFESLTYHPSTQLSDELLQGLADCME
jgi:hypothetical protein